jgi:hypothetical protein
MPPHSLSSDAARRVLARAAELDAQAAADVPVARLRDAAREAGISDAAFEAALHDVETREAEHAPPRRGRDVVGAVVVNVLAFALFWVTLALWARVEHSLQLAWEADHPARALLNVLGVFIALRLRARAVAVVLAVTAAAQVAQYPLHLLFGIEVLQGAAAKWGLMLAALLGVVFGVLMTRAVARGGRAPAVLGALLDPAPRRGAATGAEKGRGRTWLHWRPT